MTIVVLEEVIVMITPQSVTNVALAGGNVMQMRYSVTIGVMN